MAFIRRIYADATSYIDVSTTMYKCHGVTSAFMRDCKTVNVASSLMRRGIKNRIE